jgi:hypothetical protein
MDEIEGLPRIKPSDKLIEHLMSNRRLYLRTGSSLFTNDFKDQDFLVNFDKLPAEFQEEIERLAADFTAKADEAYRDISCVIDAFKDDLKYQFIIPLDSNHYERWFYATNAASDYVDKISSPRPELMASEKMFRIGFFEAAKYIKSLTQTK